jgi:hypothetical protein
VPSKVDQEETQMKRSWAALFVFVGLGACGAPATLLIDGEDQVVSDFDASLADGPAGELVVSLSVLSDPLRNAADDELSVIVNIVVPNTDAIIPGQAVEVGELLSASFDYGAFAPGDSTTPPSVTGTVTFESLSGDEAKGEASLTLSGADPEGLELGEVSLEARFRAVR